MAGEKELKNGKTADRASLVFTGDIGFDRYMDGKWDDSELIAPEVLDFLHSADHCIANVEGPLVRQQTNRTTEGVQQLLHTMNPEAVRVLKNMHADIWNICNNHMMDAGEEGVAGTLAEAKAAGARTIGAGMNLTEARRILYLPEAGGIGIFSVGYRRGCKPAGENKAGCFMWNELEMIEENIREVKKRCRWCVIVAHAGEEFTALPTPYTRDRYMKFLEMGADVIVAHHPHVPMNYETVETKTEAPGNRENAVRESDMSGSYAGKKLIFYSLGNFIFDTDYQRAQFNTEKGLLVKLMFTPEEVSFEPMGLEILRGPEHVVKAPLPKIFEDVQPDQYELLEPLAAKMFVAATKRQQIYLNRAEYANASEEKWREHFANEKRSGRVPGEALDFFVICPLAEREKEKAWEKSTLEGVKEYILEQM